MDLATWIIEAVFTGACWQAEDDYVINLCYSPTRDFAFQWTF